MPFTKPMTVSSSYFVVKEEVSHRPNVHAAAVRLAGKRGVVFKHVFHAVAANDHEVELFARHGELYARDMLGADLIGDGPGSFTSTP